jgi:hypothetical protein
MSCHHNFIAKAFCLVLDGKKMKGRANLKSVVEGASKT